MIAITNSPSENQTHRGVVSCDRCFIASSEPSRAIQAQALDPCKRGCRGICPHRLALIDFVDGRIRVVDGNAR